jgi:hypothetical protein
MMKERQEYYFLADIKILEHSLQRTRQIFQSIAEDERQPGIVRVAAAREDRDTAVLITKIKWEGVQYTRAITRPPQSPYQQQQTNFLDYHSEQQQELGR